MWSNQTIREPAGVIILRVWENDWSSPADTTSKGLEIHMELLKKIVTNEEREFEEDRGVNF